VGVQWYLVALLAPLAIWLVAFGIALGGAPLTALGRQPALLLTTFLPFTLMGLFLPSLGEEPGWRGFALPRLQAHHGPLLGTVILGALHGLWHLPAYFTAALGPFTGEKFASFVLAAVAGTFLYTWVFNRSGGSVLLVMLLHGASNAASGLLNRLIPAEVVPDGWLGALIDGGWITAIGFGLAALLLVVTTRGRLGYRPDVAMPPGPATRPTDVSLAPEGGRA
jgi:membrane protease YdiL (CAAX protease family)